MQQNKKIENPAVYLTTKEQKQSISSIKDLDNGLLYSMDYTADYKLDEIVNASLTNVPDSVGFVCQNLLSNSIPIQSNIDAGCTCFATTTSNNEKIYGRNFDYKMDMSAVLIHTNPQNGYESISLADTGWINYGAGSLNDGTTDLSMAVMFPYLIMDGMNEKGLTVSVLKLEGASTAQSTGKKAITPTLALRLLLDRAANVKEAIELLKNHDMVSTFPDADFHFFISDADGENKIIEYCNNKLVIIDGNCVANFHLDPSMNITGFGHDRYDIVKSVFSEKQNILSEKDAMSLLQQVSQEETEDSISMTQWSAVYNATNLTLTLAIRRDYEKLFNFTLRNK